MYKKPIILILEDNNITRKTLRTTLETVQDYRIIEAENRVEGLKMASLHQPDLILQNLFVGDMNGFIFFSLLLKNT
jgi:CheY-like chemotaxis protein